MAQPKRKRNSSRTTPRKRSKYVDSSASEPDSPPFWEAEGILAEQVVRGIRKYHIKWKGRDPATGRPWPTTWEPEDNANELLIEDWNRRKAVARTLRDTRESVQRQRQGHNSRVIDSSPEAAHSSSSTAASTPTITYSRANSPHIRIVPRGDSFERDEYEYFSQLALAVEETQETDLDSSQLFAAQLPFAARLPSRVPPHLHSSGGIVPGSQSSSGEASFIPIIQLTQQSTDTNGSHLYTTQDSVCATPFTRRYLFANRHCSQGLLDILQEAASRAASPALSIPETVPDTTGEYSQTQHRSIEATGALELELVPEVAYSHHGDGDETVPQVADNQCQASQPVSERHSWVDNASQPLVPISQQVGDSQAGFTESPVTHTHSQHPQNAQVISPGVGLSTQEDTSHSIRPTTEKEYVVNRASSESRHDSSQESPDQPFRSFRSSDCSSSPIPYPPSYSLKTQLTPPPRPFTPGRTSSLSIMAGESTADVVKRQLEEALAKELAANPFTPRKRYNRLSITPKAPEDTSLPTSASKQTKANEGPEGTRSPSAVPDHLPVAHAPTSLRNVAYATATATTTPITQPEPISTASEDMEVSDADADNEDNESLINDDVELADQEFCVPLYIQGRQRNTYMQHIRDKNDMLEQFLRSPGDFTPLAPIEDFLACLRAIETHIDLMFAEAGFYDDKASRSQIEHNLKWTLENSTKFMFLHTLFHKLRNEEKHVVLATEEDDDTLFKILKRFCETDKINYYMPTRDARAEGDVGKLLVTIIPSDSSLVLRHPDLIICLDGIQDATQIRKIWARSSNVVPVIHLIIPRAVSHIERYISSSLDQRARLHTILATLAQLRSDIGSALDEDTPQASVCAEMVADWIQVEGSDWPIPAIGGFKDVIQFQTQLSQAPTDSPVPPERAKRPLETGDLDPAKRMRFTPQPQGVFSSLDHISDSMPSVSTGESSLPIRLHTEDAYQREVTNRKAAEARLREHEESWDAQQTVHENLARDYRLLLAKLQATETELEKEKRQSTTQKTTLAEQVTKLNDLEQQLEKERTTHLLAPNALLAEITSLRQSLAAATSEKERALKNALTTDNTLQYTKEAYQAAQKVASTATSRIAELEAENAKLAKTASGEAVKLKQLHLGRSYELLEEKVKALGNELSVVKRTLGNKEEEVHRLRSVGRQGVGTRGTSATPQPSSKTRSRAASPSLMTGGRVANLRNG
ncbi:HDA1 complex subunit [Pyrenophora seminiperda CCB06]|uniref:HDA1 complex subunit n=1 Tax=Pyrenophora seminiperda CCB06 TaxID=1302712 RepID=A0A3M7M139_9PLEO|nr:HDA1 complex subunit [Pyrenophora seminiperda CCB06]